MPTASGDEACRVVPKRVDCAERCRIDRAKTRRVLPKHYPIVSKRVACRNVSRAETCRGVPKSHVVPINL